MAYELYKKHGTCLKGLLEEGLIPNTEASVDAFLEAVHDIPLDDIKPDPELRSLLEAVKFPRWVFTASVASHAKRCLRRLGVDDLFLGIIDCKACGLATKHSPTAFSHAMRVAGLSLERGDGGRCVFFDDSVKNLRTAKLHMGWHTVLVGLHGRDDGQRIVCAEADYEVATIHGAKEVLPFLFHEVYHLHYGGGGGGGSTSSQRKPLTPLEGERSRSALLSPPPSASSSSSSPPPPPPSPFSGGVLAAALPFSSPPRSHPHNPWRSSSSSSIDDDGGGMGAEPPAFTLLYFPLMARGLGPALVAEYSELRWAGPLSVGFDASRDWPRLKASGIAPFAQLPLLIVHGRRSGGEGEEEDEDMVVAQTTAVINCIARLAKERCESSRDRRRRHGRDQPSLLEEEGSGEREQSLVCRDDDQGNKEKAEDVEGNEKAHDLSLEGGGTGRGAYAVSQMLMGFAEELYEVMQSCVPTTSSGLGEGRKGGSAEFDAFFEILLPQHLHRLETLLQKRSTASSSPSSSSSSSSSSLPPPPRAVPSWRGLSSSSSAVSARPLAGELHLFSVLHQALAIRRPQCLAPTPPASSTPAFSSPAAVGGNGGGGGGGSGAAASASTPPPGGGSGGADATAPSAPIINLAPPPCPLVRAWYISLLAQPPTQRVLRGDSPFGPLNQFFVSP